MSLNYTTRTVTVKQREFIELHSEAIGTLAWVWQGNNHTQVTFHMQLFDHKYEWCLLGFSLQNLTDTIFSKFRSHLSLHNALRESFLQWYQGHLPWISNLKVLPSSSLPTYPLMTQVLKSLARKAWELYSLWEMDGAQHWLLFSLVFTQLHILFPALALRALSGKHVPGCSAYEVLSLLKRMKRIAKPH